MISKFPFLTRWMTEITLGTFIGVVCHACMFRIHFTLAVLVAVQTGKVFTVRWIRVTGEAFLPLSGVYACEDG
ncbi:MAG: hypothetical protein ACE5NG_12025, partial [bacterium]